MLLQTRQHSVVNLIMYIVNIELTVDAHVRVLGQTSAPIMTSP